MMEGDDLRGVQERQTQVLGHKASGKVLAAAHELLGGIAARAGALGKCRELLADGIGKLELIGDIKVALANVFEQVLARNVVLDVSTHQIEQVGHLGIALEATAAGGNHHKAARRIGVDDSFDFLEVLGICD